MRRHLLIVIVLAPLAAALLAATPLGRRAAMGVYQRLRGRATVAQRLEQYGPAARARWRPHFERARVSYPPARVVLLGLKHEKVLHIYAGHSDADLRPITSMPILAASGGPGPKLRRGDRQVPEGVYRIESLNPNSLYHLSLRVDYPNAFDREMAARDGRTDLGGDIMIHGSDASVGCLAMGDPAAEDLFTLAADTGLDRITLILSPADPHTPTPLPSPPNPPPWLPQLHALIRDATSLLPHVTRDE